jgi:hypothetical protein
MLEPGFKVACGWRGASGAPELGYSYNYMIRTVETGGWNHLSRHRPNG